jgi:hypothetical protein
VVALVAHNQVKQAALVALVAGVTLQRLLVQEHLVKGLTELLVVVLVQALVVAVVAVQVLLERLV